jgi:hypothetical protein
MSNFALILEKSRKYFDYIFDKIIYLLYLLNFNLIFISTFLIKS